jgi:CBS domain-containing protein
MKRWAVHDVMTSPAVSVSESASYHEIVDTMVSRDISAVPVVDADGYVVGLISEADLLHKIEFAGVAPARRLLERKRARAGRVKADAVVASDLMSGPAVVIRPAASIGEAAALMTAQGVKRLPVVDGEGYLAGVVSRCDLLRLYARPDDEILSEIRDQALLRTVWAQPDALSIDVKQGVVTLAGTVARRSGVTLLELLVRAVPGVVDVANNLTYRFDDRRDRPHLPSVA